MTWKRVELACVAQVQHEKFFWTAPVRAMAVTATARGIASKFLLLGTAPGQARSLCSHRGAAFNQLRTLPSLTIAACFVEVQGMLIYASVIACTNIMQTITVTIGRRCI